MNSRSPWGVVAILHDIFITMGWFFLSGRELSAPIVAAVLTIIGFSINDHDCDLERIREDLRMGVRARSVRSSTTR